MILVAISSIITALVADVMKGRPKTGYFDKLGDMITRDPKMDLVFEVLRRYATSEMPVMLLGESGTGKELAAMAIHQESPHSLGHFVAINVAAVPEALAESLLFGHVKGAFTGAEQGRIGAFQHANGGTLFLDEVGDLSLAMQAKLLRALDRGEVRRLGASESEIVHARIVTATSVDLPQAVIDGRFRADLFHRLAVLVVVLPPLRERSADIRLLSDAIANALGVTLSRNAYDALLQHDWPGNVRELQNTIARSAVLRGVGSTLRGTDLIFLTPTGRPRITLAKN